MSPKVIELPEVAASTVISIENQNLLDQGKPNPTQYAAANLKKN